MLAQNVSLIASNHCFVDNNVFYQDQPWETIRTGVAINKNVFIETGVVVLPGVEIGANSVVSAGSVVTKCIPPDQFWAGVPASYVKSLR